MATFPLAASGVAGWAAVGMPPRGTDSSPLSMVDWIVVIVLLDLSIYFSVRLMTWLHVKISSFELFRDVHRELGIGFDRRPRRRSRG
jgi:hypothetical protein